MMRNELNYKNKKERNNEKMRKERGITLIALIITILVLLILAGVVISAISENNSIIAKARDMSEEWKASEEGEEDSLNGIYGEIQKAKEIANAKPELPKIVSKVNNDNTGEIKIGDYVNYVPTQVTLTSESQIIKDLKSFVPLNDAVFWEMVGADYNKVTGANPIRQENLKWKVLDIKDGQVRLISEAPTNSVVRLESLGGYNNGVKLLDNLCNELYSGDTGIAQNLKIEDIQEYLTYNYKAGGYGNIGDESETIASYPSIFPQENWQFGNPTTGKLGLSEQDVWYTGAVGTAKKWIMKTYWTKSMVSGDFKDNIYYKLFINNGSNYVDYWLSSRCVEYFPGNMVVYQMSKISNGKVAADGQWDSFTDLRVGVNSIRPVVTLNANVEVTGGNGTAGWNIK